MVLRMGRLKPGVTLDQARAEMKAIAARLEKSYPESNLNTTAAGLSSAGKHRRQIPAESRIPAGRSRSGFADRLCESRESFRGPRRWARP